MNADQQDEMLQKMTTVEKLKQEQEAGKFDG